MPNASSVGFQEEYFRSIQHTGAQCYSTLAGKQQPALHLPLYTLMALKEQIASKLTAEGFGQMCSQH